MSLVLRCGETIAVGLVELFSVVDESDGGTWLSLRFSVCRGRGTGVIRGCCSSGTCGMLVALSSDIHLISSRS